MVEETWLIANNIFYGNEGEFELSVADASNVSLAHNLIEGNKISNNLIGVRVNPIRPPASATDLFASLEATHANYLRLKPGAVGINAGNNDYIDGEADIFEEADTVGVRDLAGNKRINGEHVDVGAYEFQGTSPSAHSLTVATEPTTSDLPAAGGRIGVTIIPGGGATGWEVVELSDADNFISLPATTSGTGRGVLTLTYAANTETRLRQAQIEVRTTGAGEAQRETLTLRQQARTSIAFGAPEGVFANVRIVNPVSNNLVIHGLPMEAGLGLRDMLGRQIFTSALSAGRQHVPLPPLKQGVYFLVLKNERGETYNLRLLKE